MRAVRLTIVLILCSSCLLSAQLSWAPLGATWYYNKKEGGQASPPAYGYLKIEAVKDTLIEDQPTTVLEMSRYISNGQVYTVGSIYTFAKDSIIYTWTDGNTSVLYDFTKKASEEHEITGFGFNDCGNSSIGSVIVDSCGHRTINGFESSFYYCSPTDTSIWEYQREINSIFGSVNFMFAYPVFCDVMDVENFAGILRCYSDDRIGTINLGEIPCDTLIPTGFQDPESVSDEIWIYPNPCNDYFTLAQLSPFSQPCFTIFNLLGEAILDSRMIDPEEIVDVSTFSKGFYIIRINGNTQESIVKKLIKQ